MNLNVKIPSADEIIKACDIVLGEFIRECEAHLKNGHSECAKDHLAQQLPEYIADLKRRMQAISMPVIQTGMPFDGSHIPSLDPDQYISTNDFTTVTSVSAHKTRARQLMEGLQQAMDEGAS